MTTENCYLVCHNANDPVPADAHLAGWLDELGYNVILRTHTQAPPTDDGSLVVLSSSADSWRTEGYWTWSGPVLATETQGGDDLRIANSNALFYNGTQIDIVDDTHPVAVELSLSEGNYTIFSSTHEIDVSQGLGAGADVLAENPASDSACIYTYDEGATLTDGSAANGRRGFFGTTRDWSVPSYHANYQPLFNAVIRYLDPTPEEEPPPDPPPGSGGLPSDPVLTRPDPITPGTIVPIYYDERKTMLESRSVQIYLGKCEVLDENDNVLNDIVTKVTNLTITHDTEQAVHRSCELVTDAVLDWSRHRIRPYIYIAGGGYADLVPQGIFLLTAPKPDASMTPIRYTVTGFDKLYLVNQVMRQHISFPSGEPVLNAVFQILAQHGFTTVNFDPDRANSVLPEPRVWFVQDGLNALDVANELLDSVTYNHVHMSLENGLPKASTRVSALYRPIMWEYNTASTKGIVLTGSTDLEDDFTAIPNYYVFYRTDIEFETPPAENDGIFIYRNENFGPSSINARGGTYIPHVEGLEAVSQGDLEAQGRRIAEEMIRGERQVTFTSRLNPYHSHLDVMEFTHLPLAIHGPHEHVSYEHNVGEMTTTHTVRAVYDAGLS